MVVQFPATVTIGGVAIAGEWDGSAVTALADLQIIWGRNEVYDPSQPASLTLSLIDVEGNYATDNDLIGTAIVIGRTSPTRTMFRGQITGLQTTLTTVSHPTTGAQIDVFVVTLTAADKLAQLAQTRVSQAQAVVYGDGTPVIGGWWRPDVSANRVGQLNTYGGILSIVSSVASPNIPTLLGLSAPASTDTAYLHQRWGRDNLSLLELLEELYICVPLGHVNYNANTDGIEVGTTAQNAGTQLTLVATLITITPLAGLTIDASQLQLPDGEATISSTVAAAIDLVQTRLAHSTNGGEPWDEAFVEVLTARGAGSATRRVLTIPTWFRDNFSGTGSYGDVYATALANKVVDLVDDINGQFTPPPLRFDFRRGTSGVTAVDDILLDTMDHADALYLEGSQLNHLPNVGPQFQLIGGTIRWAGQRAGSNLEAGWVVDMRLAPATGVISPVDMGSLITNGTPNMADFDPNITLADLGTVTIGLA